MYDLVLIASKPSDWTHEEFITWWRGPHADLTRSHSIDEAGGVHAKKMKQRRGNGKAARTNGPAGR